MKTLWCSSAHLDLPLLTVTSCGRDLCVDLRPRLQHLVDVYNTSEYQLRIQSSNHRAQVRHMTRPGVLPSVRSDGTSPWFLRVQFFRETRSLQRQILTDLLPGVSYCVSIRFSDKLFSRESNFSQPQCVSTLGSFPAGTFSYTFSCIFSCCFKTELVLVSVFCIFRCLSGCCSQFQTRTS